MAYGYDEFKKDVYSLTDIDLNMYKERQMKRRIESLINQKGISGFEEFYKGMEQDKDLLHTFVSYLTINVSQFYRNPIQWETLEKNMIPYLLEHFSRINIWSAACSTGDEPYTLAMIFKKYIPTERLKIIATDIDDDVLAYAQNGIYTAKSLADLPKEYLLDNFTKLDDNHYEISDEIKKCVTFKKHNLLRDGYFDKQNLVVCRNVVIYFTDEAKDHVYHGFNKALVKNGLLFIGSTEQILRAKEFGFESKKTFFYKKI